MSLVKLDGFKARSRCRSIGCLKVTASETFLFAAAIAPVSAAGAFFFSLSLPGL